MPVVTNKAGWGLVLVCLLFCLLCPPLYGQTPTSAGQLLEITEPLRVGITQDPPLAMRTDDDRDGLAVYLWQQVIGPLGLTYHYIEGSPKNWRHS